MQSKASTKDAPRTETMALSAEPATKAPHCSYDSWSTYAHDAQRSSASLGCCRFPLRPLWRFVPPDLSARKGYALHAIALSSDIYVAARLGDSSSLHRLDSDGHRIWYFDSKTDINRAHWPTAALQRVILSDDGFFILDPATGKQVALRGLDSWGETSSDGTRLFAVNTYRTNEGPSPYIGAFDDTGKPYWMLTQRNNPEAMQDDAGGMVHVQGVLVHAYYYRFAGGSGLSGYDPKGGKMLWMSAVQPRSAISASDDKVFLVERDSKLRSLVLSALSPKDGKRIWSSEVPDTDGQAPMIGSGRVFTVGQGGKLIARSIRDGSELWSAELSSSKELPMHATRAAIALGNAAVVATSGSTLRLLSIENGQVLSEQTVDNLAGELHSPILAHGRLYAIAGGAVLAFACAADSEP